MCLLVMMLSSMWTTFLWPLLSPAQGQCQGLHHLELLSLDGFQERGGPLLKVSCLNTDEVGQGGAASLLQLYN